MVIRWFTYLKLDVLSDYAIISVSIGVAILFKWLHVIPVSQSYLQTMKFTCVKHAYDHQVQVYAVGSSCDNGIHLLDFYPGPTSPCHVDYK